MTKESSRAVLRLEARKLAGSPVTRLATAGTLLLTTVTTVGGYAASRLSPDTDMGRKSASLILAPGWDGYIGLAAMSVGITMLLTAGIVMAWAVGREFTDGTIVGLFAVPPSTAAVLTGKIAVTGVWVVLLAMTEGLLLGGAGVALGLALGGAWRAVAVITVVAVTLGLSALPVMWVATRWRGYLAGIAATLALVVVTNVAAGFGLGSFIPWAVPVLWATPGSGVSALLLTLPTAVALLGAWAARRAWRGLQLGAG